MQSKTECRVRQSPNRVDLPTQVAAHQDACLANAGVWDQHNRHGGLLSQRCACSAGGRTEHTSTTQAREWHGQAVSMPSGPHETHRRVTGTWRDHAAWPLALVLATSICVFLSVQMCMGTSGCGVCIPGLNATSTWSAWQRYSERRLSRRLQNNTCEAPVGGWTGRIQPRIRDVLTHRHKRVSLLLPEVIWDLPPRRLHAGRSWRLEFDHCLAVRRVVRSVGGDLFRLTKRRVVMLYVVSHRGAVTVTMVCKYLLREHGSPGAGNSAPT